MNNDKPNRRADVTIEMRKPHQTCRCHAVAAYHIELDELRAGSSVDESAQLAGYSLVLGHELLHRGAVLSCHQLHDLALQFLQNLP